MKNGKANAASDDDRPDPGWLPLIDLAEIEITSEASAFPIEGALVLGGGTGWRADAPGKQTLRLRFQPPLLVRQIRLLVEERDRARTQELVLRVAFTAEGPWREVVRQQFNFSPSGAMREQEDYRVDQPSIAALELTIVPDISGGDSRASLEQLRVA